MTGNWRPLTAPDFADKIAERLAAQHLTASIAFDDKEQHLITLLMSVAARQGYMLALGVKS